MVDEESPQGDTSIFVLVLGSWRGTA